MDHSPAARPAPLFRLARLAAVALLVAWGAPARCPAVVAAHPAGDGEPRVHAVVRVPGPDIRSVVVLPVDPPPGAPLGESPVTGRLRDALAARGIRARVRPPPPDASGRPTPAMLVGAARLAALAREAGADAVVTARAAELAETAEKRPDAVARLPGLYVAVPGRIRTRASVVLSVRAVDRRGRVVYEATATFRPSGLTLDEALDRVIAALLDRWPGQR